MTTRAVIKVIDEDHVVATWYRTVIQVWRRPVSSAKLLEMNTVFQALLAESTEPVTSISIVEEGSTMPRGDTLRTLALWSRDTVSRTALAVAVSEGDSFRTALTRAVSIALSKIIPHRVPFVFFSDVADAAARLRPHLVHPPGESLCDVIVELRRHFDTLHPPRAGR